MTSALVAAVATGMEPKQAMRLSRHTLVPSPLLHPSRAGALTQSAVCHTPCHSTGVSPRESAQFPTEVKDVGSSSLLVTLFGGWGWPVHSGPLGVH
jgi:hypothetical protein